MGRGERTLTGQRPEERAWALEISAEKVPGRKNQKCMVPRQVVLAVAEEQ